MIENLLFKPEQCSSLIYFCEISFFVGLVVVLFNREKKQLKKHLDLVGSIRFLCLFLWIFSFSYWVVNY